MPDFFRHLIAVPRRARGRIGAATRRQNHAWGRELIGFGSYAAYLAAIMDQLGYDRIRQQGDVMIVDCLKQRFDDGF